MALVWIPAPMQKLTNGESRVAVDGKTLRELIDNLDRRYPGIREMLVQGELIKDEIAVAIDGEISHQGLFQPLGEPSEVHFIPALGGGSEPEPCEVSYGCLG